jgi:dephospho-CoA kinase
VLADWRRRIDRVIVVTAPDDLKIARYVARINSSSRTRGRGADARVRLAHQIPDAEKAAEADYVLENTGDRRAGGAGGGAVGAAEGGEQQILSEVCL